MKAWRSILALLTVTVGLSSTAAFAQSLSTLSNDGFAPMSLIPDGVAIPKAGSFGLINPAPADVPSDETGVSLPAARSIQRASVEAPAVEPKINSASPPAVEVAQAPADVDIPMPPRRPFNLGFGKKQKPLLAKAIVESAKPGSLTRSLVAMEDLPGVRLRSGDLIQQASLSTKDAVQSDAIPDVGPVIGDGRGGGIIKQTPSVEIGCLRPDLVALLRQASKRFGRPVIVTSGFRSGGRRGSYHRKCMAADVEIDGVNKQTLAAYFRSLPQSGGVGTYCHNGVVHIDTAEPRNWTYCGFRRTSFSLRGGGWNGNVHVRAGQALPDSGDDTE